jgi:hypothetical protein
MNIKLSMLNIDNICNFHPLNNIYIHIHVEFGFIVKPQRIFLLSPTFDSYLICETKEISNNFHS